MLGRIRAVGMETLYDLMAATLFVATAGMFFWRLRHETPAVAPYALISIVCAVSNWLGNHGGGIGAALLLIAGSFYLLHIAGEPFAEEGE
jgi:hypothetical protein